MSKESSDRTFDQKMGRSAIYQKTKRHGVVIDVWGNIHDDEIKFEISDQSCALCQNTCINVALNVHYMKN